MKSDKVFPMLAFVLFLAEIALVLVSWIISASMPTIGIRSLLGGEGIRWMVSRHTDILASPLLVYIMFFSITYGCWQRSGIQKLFSKCRPLGYRERIALKYTILSAIIYVAALFILTVIPHAVLLGVDGSLWHSPFRDGIIPLLALGICSVSFVYGMLVGSLDTVSALYRACVFGLKVFAPLFLFYILGACLLNSLLYVLCVIQ